MPGLPDLSDTKYFPPLYELPHEYFLDRLDIDAAQPRKHWCLLAEIVEEQPWPFRPMYRAKDITGQTFLASFHYDDRTLFPGVPKRGVVGSTICVMYAYFHRFVDGQTGVRLEEPKDVKILPLGIEELVAVSKTVRDGLPVSCAFCQEHASNRCSRCSAISYCSKTCQMQDWERHKKVCVTIRQMKIWNEFDWM